MEQEIMSFLVSLFKKYLFIYLLTEGKGGREGEKHHCVVATHMVPTGPLACNPGMCPDWESNQQPFGSQPMLNPWTHASQGSCLIF